MHAALALPMPISRDELDFSAFVERHQAQVFGTTLSVLGDRARAEELAQEAFLVAWHKLEGGARVDNRAAWVCEIARNLARNARRRGHEEPRPELEAASDAPSALDVLVERERDRGVQRALAALPDKYREPLVLFYVGGESVREVAEALSLNEAAVRQRLDRGRDQVRAQLASIETGLRGQRPGAVFTALVLAAFSLRSTSAKAATLGSIGMGLKLAALACAVGAAVVVIAMRPHTPGKSPPTYAVASPGAPAPTSTQPARPASSPRTAARTPAPAPVSDEPALPPGLLRPLDLDLNRFTADAAFNLLGEACDVPIVVKAGEDFSASTNVKATNQTGIQVLDELLAQAGATRTPQTILTIGRGLGPTTLDDGATFDLDLDGMLLDQAVSTIAAKLGEPIFLPGSVGKMPVHGKLVGFTAQAALEAVLAPVQMGFERKPGFLIAPDEP